MDFTQVDWQKVLPKFGIHEDYLRKRHGPCPLCEQNGRGLQTGKKRRNIDRFRFDNKNNMGTWFCQHCGAGNALTLLRKYTGACDRTILADIQRYNESLQGNYTPAKPWTPAWDDVLSEQELIRRRTFLAQAWRASVGLFNDPVTTYLKSRVPGLKLHRLGREIRYHRGMKFLELDDHDKTVNRGVFPVMLARVVDGNRKPVTLHRTYLTNDGTKAPFEKVKKQMQGVRKLQGAAIRLNEVPGCRTLGVCEGIETGLAIVTAYRYRMPVWSLLNCGNLAVADVPKAMFDKVIIFADHDPVDVSHGYRPGEHYAKKLRDKLQSEGFAVEIRIPPRENMDFADLWFEHYHSLMKAA